MARRRLRRILVVEDNRQLLRGLLAFLEGAGHQVTGADSFHAARALLGGNRFDLVISDLDLPGGTGLELISRARAHGCGAAFVLITGYGCSAVRKQARELEVLGYLEKPFDPAVLLRLIATLPERDWSSTEPNDEPRTELGTP